jgi:hypothetical protein
MTTRKLHNYYKEIASGSVIYAIDFDGARYYGTRYDGTDSKGTEVSIDAREFESDEKYLPLVRS